MSKPLQKSLIVVIDDDEAARTSLAQLLTLRRFDVRTFSSGEAALAWSDLPDCDVIVSDIKMPGMNGEELLAEVIRRRFMAPVILITGHGDVSMAVRCLKSGAYDFIEKPFDNEVILASVRRAVEKVSLSREANELRRRLTLCSGDEVGRFGLIGRSRVMQDLFDQIENVAKSRAIILIHGETGSGKELVAKAIHNNSPRAAGPYIAVNAAALPESMLESELFGHARGAFTGAESARDGKLVAASGGTLLLDEVESISLKAQAQLLRVLEDGQVFPLGRDVSRTVDLRVLTATKMDLSQAVRQGLMREDFFHRIMVLPIRVPALRERLEDIPLLVSHFLRQAADRNGIPVPRISEETLDALMRYSWPGNVRELKHAIERMVITSRDGWAGPFQNTEDATSSRLLSVPPGAGRLKDALEATEKQAIIEGLKVNDGEVSATALYLGISRRALYERMKKNELERSDFG
ncbi:MAG TPA: sigma-54 dependent transcriptional regulator [Myxococcota bacterium]|nr:sigma-54 dependent transcriptional regulator [Myxococcota bacterium]HRR73653.1 sigma-54 dependent transcriptional regulator [Myxococcota bacterium]HRV17914.1 sigma-54 dependent transcriptional regulator [Myxococcota bacterium]